jgi:geranylgeranyl diphosphate synthase type I
MLHGFILIHDDIIDRSELRRGEPSLHRLIEKRISSVADRQRTGANLALVMGDVLFALAQKCLLDGGAARREAMLSRLLLYIFETGVGEASDIVYGIQDISKVSLHDVEEMYLRKTTRYTIECPLVLAAVAAGCDEGQIHALGRVAEPAGLAFQIQNDLQEFTRFEVSDADIPADVLEGKKTYLVRKAFALLSESDRGILQLCLNGVSPSAASINKVRELVLKSGAIDQSRKRMNELFETAVHEARQPVFSAGVQEGLVSLTHLLGQITNGEIHRVHGAAK